MEVNCNAYIFVTQKWNINKGTMKGERCFIGDKLKYPQICHKKDVSLPVQMQLNWNPCICFLTRDTI